MKIALLTDSHAGVKSDSLAFHDYMKRFYDFFLVILLILIRSE